MRLRRLEFVIIGVTLAFACFMGGFFTGRNWSTVSITAVATQNGGVQEAGIALTPSGQTEQDRPVSPGASPADISNPRNAGDTAGTAGETQADRSPDTAGTPRNGDGKININTASQSELMDLPGIGSVLASRIVDYRRQNGSFLTIEEIRNVSGIGEKRYDTIKDKITVG